MFYNGSSIADGGDFKVLLLHHSPKLNSSTNAQLWNVCPTIGNILLAAVNIFKMETINVELKLDHKIDIDVRLDDVIDGINDCEMKRRWNFIAQIINGVQLNLSDLTEEQKAIIKKYITDKLSLF
ncbi:MAG: hypothetical protein QG556_293 [Pseudomonadota bacterium]|nr:hypothetical protein [Pseudomonadota bacterium]